LKNAENKNLVKIKRIPNSEIEASRGAHFLHLVCQGGAARTPAPRQSRHCSLVANELLLFQKKSNSNFEHFNPKPSPLWLG